MPTVGFGRSKKSQHSQVTNLQGLEKFIPFSVWPLIQTFLLSHPWERVVSELLKLNKRTYLLVAETILSITSPENKHTTSASTINALKAIFLRHGISSIS